MPDRDTHQIIPFQLPRKPQMPGLRIRDLHVTRRNVALLNGVELDLSPTGTTAILGPNGAGKSLVLRVIAGLISPDQGRVQVPRAMQGRIGLVLQKPVLLRRSVRANLRHALALARVPRRDRGERVSGLLALGHLEPLADRPARHLSGGEQQRLAIIRALAANPLLLMLDEPTAHLDPHATHAIEALVARVASEGTKVILVTHDIGQVQRLADEVAFLHQGRCHEQADKTDFLSAPTSAAARAYLNGKLLL
jgi:tungstate transport system ATP-binding protein